MSGAYHADVHVKEPRQTPARRRPGGVGGFKGGKTAMSGNEEHSMTLARRRPGGVGGLKNMRGQMATLSTIDTLHVGGEKRF